MRIAIAGYGMEGEASYRYYTARGDEVTILDERETLDRVVPEGARVILGPDAFSHLEIYDTVIRTPALPPRRLVGAQKIWSATNEFFAQCPAPIIGVTGTKGKGTTSSLITSILRAAGRTVHLVGNIGAPALEVLDSVQPGDIVVYELSSFQLWDIEHSPHIAVVLMIEPDHLNVHANMTEYVTAKANIAKRQTKDDIVIYHPDNHYSADIAGYSIGKKVRYGGLEDGGAYVKDGYFMVYDTPICLTDMLRLAGSFNFENACAAITATYNYTQDSDVIARGLNDFDGLPHRLKFVAKKNGVRYYDDSIATTPGSAIAALKSFEGPRVVILGGESKGVAYDEVVQAAATSSVKIVAIGEVGHTIVALASRMGVYAEYVEGLMDQVVPAANRLAGNEGVVILCPATASFDQYAGYADRGNQFISAVNTL